ncbi:hypothetical protein ACFLS9_01910 [Bacteroidota bacterium]
MKKKIKIFIIPIIILFLFNNLLFSQSSTNNSKRFQEHQAVKELLRSVISSSPKSTIPLDDNKPYEDGYLNKISDEEDRKTYFMNGNRLGVEIYNYGGIGPGYGLIRNVNNLVWRDLGYIFQFGPIVGAEVKDQETGEKIHIISDGLNDYMTSSYRLQEVNPADETERWQWQPLPGYADPDQPSIASNPAPDDDGDGKPDSWPRDWYNATLGKYVWPGFLSQDATNADLEVFWAMDDRANREFEYYPFEGDTTKRGLGVQIDARAFQWSNALAENTIFFVYTITNVSDKRLDSVLFGIYGDPDLGGGSPENTDDNGYFVPPYSTDSVDVSNVPVYARSMVYFWDPDMTGNFGLPLGYLGCKFLESPGNPENNFDDDGDGMIDERQDDGIDNDGDWNIDLHDVGIDGIANTGDQGEGDGLPTAGLVQPDGSPHPLFPGEPNFEFTDLDESDQIGLTSFNSWTWNQDKISNDESMWNRNIPGNFSDIQQNTDIVFVFGSGYISLDAGETKRISMALLCGEDLDDLLISAEVVQTIYNQNYQFFKPPITPTVSAVPGDKKVTLYWDTKSEESIDPITGNDFEGYVIYRSTDPSFRDIQNITDGKGTSFLSEPLKDVFGVEAKWDVALRDEPFVDQNDNGLYDSGEPYSDWNKDQQWTPDIEDPWKGYHPVPYKKRGLQYYLGNNTGLVHSFVDSNNVINGQTYYYAVVAYDHGDSVGIPVTETTKKITVDPITSKFTFDDNTVMVIPGPRASGYIPPELNNENVEHIEGIGTGVIAFEILNDLVIEEQGSYTLSFSDSLWFGSNRIYRKNYSVLDDNPVTEKFFTFDTNFYQLQHRNISNDSYLEVKGLDGTLYNESVDYVLNHKRGAIRRTESGNMPNQSELNITYRYFPVFESANFMNEDSNPVFDGIIVKVYDEEALAFDEDKSRWVEGNTNYEFTARLSTVGAKKMLYPGDFELSFSSQNVDSAITFIGQVLKIPVNYIVKEISTGVPIPVITFLAENPATRDTAWSPGEEIIFFKPGSEGSVLDTLTWGVVITASQDTNLTPILPTDGDVLLITTKRPFDTKDMFKLETNAGKYSSLSAKSKLDNIYVVPNPYIGYNVIEPSNKLPGQTRGEKRIYFENLPPECSIRIYTIAGDHVKTLNHVSSIEHGREYWNLLNSDGFGVAYGVYIAHINAPGIGEKILKFALIK